MTTKHTLAEIATAWAKGEIVLQRAPGSHPWNKVPALGLNLPVHWDSRLEYKLKERNPPQQKVYMPVSLDFDGHVVIGPATPDKDQAATGDFILSLDFGGQGEHLYVRSYGYSLDKVAKPGTSIVLEDFDKAAEVPS